MPESDVNSLRSTMTENMNSGKGIVLPNYGDDQNNENSQVEKDEPQVEQVENIPKKQVVKKKVDQGKSAITFDKKGNVVFNGPINWEAKSDPEIQTVNGSHFYFRQENIRFKNVAAEHNLSLLEALHILIADSIENGLPEDMLERYLAAKGE